MAATTKKSQRGGKVAGKPPAPKQQSQQFIPIRIPLDLIERIDAIKPDMIPREPYVRHLLDLIVTDMEEEE